MAIWNIWTVDFASQGLWLATTKFVPMEGILLVSTLFLDPDLECNLGS